MNRLGQVDSVLLQPALPLRRGLPGGAFVPYNQAEADGQDVGRNKLSLRFASGEPFVWLSTGWADGVETGIAAAMYFLLYDRAGSRRTWRPDRRLILPTTESGWAAVVSGSR